MVTAGSAGTDKSANWYFNELRSNLKTDSKKIHWPKNILLMESPQFYYNLTEILAILPTHGLIILTKFDED